MSKRIPQRRLSRRDFLGGAVAAGCVGCVEPGAAEHGHGPELGSTGGTGSTEAAGYGNFDQDSIDGASESSTGAPSVGDEDVEPLNILLITADDLGWKSLESHGAVDHCRHINDLARRAKSFPFAFNVTSSCSSSRASFATGLYPSQHGVSGLVHRHPQLSLPPKSNTVARTLQSAGYATGIAGKFHISDTAPASKFGYGDVGPRRLKKMEFVDDFLASHAGGPFYLELNYKHTHRAGNPRRFKMDPRFPVSANAVRVPEYWALPDLPEIRESVARYLSQMCAMDDLIGRTLASLEARGLMGTTLVLFVSDNGVSYPGNKSTLYDRGIGSPCILWDPRTEARGTDDALVSSIDYAPTLLDAAGLVDPQLAGHNLCQPSRPRSALFAEMFQHKSEVGIRAVRTRRWKYIVNTSLDPIGSGEVSEPWEEALHNRPWAEARTPFELYDLQTDPHEQTNLVSAMPELVAELHARLAQHTQATGDETLIPAPGA